MSAQIYGLYVTLSPSHLEPGMFIHRESWGWQEVKSVQSGGQGHVYVEVKPGWIAGAFDVRFDRVAVQLSGPLEGKCARCNWLERYCRCHDRETCIGVWRVDDEFWFCGFCYPLAWKWEGSLIGPQQQLPAECQSSEAAWRRIQHIWAKAAIKTPTLWSVVSLNWAVQELLALPEYPGSSYGYRDDALLRDDERAW